MMHTQHTANNISFIANKFPRHIIIKTIIEMKGKAAERGIEIQGAVMPLRIFTFFIGNWFYWRRLCWKCIITYLETQALTLPVSPEQRLNWHRFENNTVELCKILVKWKPTAVFIQNRRYPNLSNSYIWDDPFEGLKSKLSSRIQTNTLENDIKISNSWS